MNRIATFVQVSDLHLGHLDPRTGSSQDHAAWAYFKVCEGLVGHDYVALRRLASYFDGLRKAEDAQLIVTGDLTSCGHVDQFDSACDFLGGRLVTAKSTVGLRARDFMRRAIPGNHDSWSGSPFPKGPPTSGLRNCFPNLPYTFRMPLQATKYGLHFMAIDTDADVGVKTRLQARGEFHTQLQALDALLNPAEDTEIRVLLLHHSRNFGDPNWTGNLTMVDASRRALEDFIVRQNVKVLLCGHTHASVVKSFTAVAASGLTAEILECCCGTTTQRDTVPATWTAFWNQWGGWQFKPNALLVHRLYEDQHGAIVWETEQLLRKALGFTPDKTYPSVVVS